MQNHGRSMLACDFFLTVTAGFRRLYVFVVLEVGTRRILHWNITEHPTSAWTVQQFRMVVSGQASHRFLVHDRVFAEGFDAAVTAMGLTVLKTPVRPPASEPFCERLDRHDAARVS